MKILTSILLFAAIAGAQATRPAAALLDEAKAQAGDQRKLLVIFHASW